MKERGSQMESGGGKRTQRYYTLALKLAAADQVEKSELSYKQAQERYGIQGRLPLLVHGRQNWARWCHTITRVTKPQQQVTNA